MNKKKQQKCVSSNCFTCTSYISQYLDSMNTCKIVSKHFCPSHIIKHVKVVKTDISTKHMLKLLLKKNILLQKLDLSNCIYLNTRVLTKLLGYFKNLNILVLDNCHSLVSLSCIKPHVYVSCMNLWRPYKNSKGFTPEDVITIIMNSYNYITEQCRHNQYSKAPLNKLKSFCNAIDASFLVYTIDTLLYRISPVQYIIEDKQELHSNEITFYVNFFSTYGSVKMKWKLNNEITGTWMLYEAWLIS